MSPASSAGGPASSALTSGRLLARARLGDASALGQLLGRYYPDLRRWARRRLPVWVRTANDTSDLIQDVLLRTLRRIDGFDRRGRRALAGYLQRAVRNRINDEHRRVGRRGVPQALTHAVADAGPSPLDRVLAGETQARYRAALARLRRRDRELIVAHVELDYSHEQLGCMIGRSANAARMALQRAIGRLAQQMADA